MPDLVGQSVFKNTIRAMEETDLNHPSTFNPVYQDLLNNDVALKEQADANTTGLNNTQNEVQNHINDLSAHGNLSMKLNIVDLAIELETLKGATLTGVSANIFVETFINLDDITLLHGAYDNMNKQVYLP